ncbi:MAG: class I SAM-dependent methyltransferase [Chitinivibrionia bacterium]|jgi:ubiquinone/menaquinone biosynthesis C-methylase UbiE|nr:class I SAM-dependent methyltransferase [Chitinivibrionia bacterium]
MVTDIKSNYTSPAGKEFTLVAGRFAGISPASNVLDVGCGYGDGVCNIVSEFRCKATAIDINKDNIKIAQTSAEQRRISHLITFITSDVLQEQIHEKAFDLILAEGGVLTMLGREKSVEMINKLLSPRGWLAFSDLIFLTNNDKIPPEILNIYDDERFKYETESGYRKLLKSQGFDIHLMTLVPQSGWDNYYAHMARRLEDQTGFFADKQVKTFFHREMDIFYRLEAFKYIGYLFGLVRKSS